MLEFLRWTDLLFARYKMRSIGYSAFDDLYNTNLNNCNRSSDELPLLINCAGNFSTEMAFTTHNKVGRVDYYLLYVISGSLAVELPDGWTICHRGNFVIFPPNIKYIYSHKASDLLEYMFVHFTGSDVEKILALYDFSLYPKTNKLTHDEQIILRFNNIFDGFSKQDVFRDKELSLLLERLFISMARRSKDVSQKENQLRRSIAFINSRYNGNIKIPELARIENLSVSRYNTLFKEIMKLSPTEYITKLRISSARELLSGTDLPIGKVSQLVGYRDPHFFSRIFKATMGVSPIEYKNNSK